MALYLSPALNVMTAAARKAGRKLIRDFGEVEQLQISLKGPADFVTVADQRTESILVGELQKARAGYPILTEEAGLIDGPDKSHRFIIDPLDGTTNFLHGIPHFAISIALEREGQLVSGVIFNPVTDEMFVAEKGHGAYLNDKRLRVAARKQVKEALFATGVPFMGKEGHERFLKELAAVMAATPGVRRFGSAALDLAWVAAGRYDGFWERDLKPWDVAAGILMVREAHGVVTDMEGGAKMLDCGHVLASNEALHPQFLKLLKDAGRN
ncbi:MAG: inositol monophosphatase [Alphaproteobacteria bacterium]|nr:inositol monophosphatase [Alphaproteobacteria bacterium]MBU6471480.1 inositol monophosphatase [Alphaproteobacteria bacterium]MDE2014457.1 inositol monophosphatase [Alphaproteobacteria bacterium]MDE2072149.1 inositol monophosphatase [Alphaproteobacteria bacterium]MDE2353155.1 inositol monophosphatase [Alphaproteobacteria bacterium]